MLVFILFLFFPLTSKFPQSFFKFLSRIGAPSFIQINQAFQTSHSTETALFTVFEAIRATGAAVLILQDPLTWWSTVSSHLNSSLRASWRKFSLDLRRVSTERSVFQRGWKLPGRLIWWPAPRLHLSSACAALLYKSGLIEFTVPPTVAMVMLSLASAAEIAL